MLIRWNCVCVCVLGVMKVLTCLVELMQLDICKRVLFLCRSGRLRGGVGDYSRVLIEDQRALPFF